jgi:DNA helicase-2/ATP-dependent DNA helicase PcrA
MNLFLEERALPKELIVCTLTEKAAYELRDRIATAARKVGYKRDLSELRVAV